MAKKTITPEQEIKALIKLFNAQRKDLLKQEKVTIREAAYFSKFGHPASLVGTAIDLAKIQGAIAALNELAYKLKINK